MVKTFYICSYGGCGSTLLFNSLKKYGNTEHVHSRNPPEKLEYVGYRGGGKCYNEWFNGIKIPEEEIDNYYVIYIYKNPIKSIFSRFTIPQHLSNVQTKRETTIDDVINSSSDLYGIKEFYNNYVKKNNNRNYKIYCVKYEDIFEKQNELSELLGIENLNLVKKETERSELEEKYYDKLYPIYSDLIEEMDKNDFITIV